MRIHSERFCTLRIGCDTVTEAGIDLGGSRVQLRRVPSACFHAGDALGRCSRLTRAKERGGQCNLRVAVRSQLCVSARERERLGGCPELDEMIDCVPDARFGKRLEALAINGLGALDPL